MTYVYLVTDCDQYGIRPVAFSGLSDAKQSWKISYSNTQKEISFVQDNDADITVMHGSVIVGQIRRIEFHTSPTHL